jgi:Mn2+/Fe2+ NRAMP family transporter
MDQPASAKQSEFEILNPPTTFWGTVSRLGPGLIIAGSIVGSGELIATTKTGAQAGISLLWLIIVGCVIKVFAQIELGRYAVCNGEHTLWAMNRLPGPRLIANWIVWMWFIMLLCTIGQLGGIVGGTGQAMAMTLPITGDYQHAVSAPSRADFQRFLKCEADLAAGGIELAKLSDEQQQRARRGHEVLKAKIDKLGPRGLEILEKMKADQPLVDASGQSLLEQATRDDKIWVAVVAVLTSALLFWGRYGLIQNVSTVLVVTFTFVTIGNVISLQTTERWSIPTSEIVQGLMFSAPVSGDPENPWVLLKTSPWLVALATFGIIGVGANELIQYPYWCLEKGYAKFAGPRTNEASWAARARGWLWVMHYDAFLSMVIYTLATLAFFFMGVAVLHQDGLDPSGMRMVSTLAEAYVPVFGEYARWLFLIGALAVLYSTFLVANAGHARAMTDGATVVGWLPVDDEQRRQRLVAILSAILPILCGVIYWLLPDPVLLVMIGGISQSVMLPALGFAAVYFRFKSTDARIAPGRLWDACLIVSVIGLFIAGGWGVFSETVKLLGGH